MADESIKLSIQIVYFACINTSNKWVDIIRGQILDIKASGILDCTSALHIVLTDEDVEATHAQNIEAIVRPEMAAYPSLILEFTVSHDNQYEYPGFAKLHEIATNTPNEDPLIIYLHSKGMYFHGNIGRIQHEKVLTKHTLQSWKDIIKVFQENSDTKKACLFPSSDGFAWFNFFWVRASYLRDECCAPLVSMNNRYYYEGYIGQQCSKTFSDCYNIYEKKKGAYCEPRHLCRMLSTLR